MKGLSLTTGGAITDRQISIVRMIILAMPSRTVHHSTILRACDPALRGDQACREVIAAEYNRLVEEAPPPGALTSATITDLQIHDLLETFLGSALAHVHRHKDMRLCRIAVGGIRKSKAERAAARERCAEILNEEARARCAGRRHDQHIGFGCQGACCSACGGPIDEDEECRC